MTDIKQMSENGTDFFPVTNMKAVYNDDGERLDNVVNEINENLTTSDNLKFRFATDGEGNYGYLKADDSFVPFKSGAKYIGVFSSTFVSWNSETIDISSYANYNNLTIDDIILELVAISRSSAGSGSGDYSPFTYSYNSTNGLITIDKPNWGLWKMKFKIWVLK